MYKIITNGFLILLSSIFVAAEIPKIIELEPGTNEITVKVINKSQMNLDSVYIVAKQEDLPAGFNLSIKSQHVTIFANSQDEVGLLLQIEIDEHAKSGVYDIPFMLEDQARHSWHYTLKANLKIPKPEHFDLLPNYPNPFNNSTQIKYMLPHEYEQHTRVVIFDVLGKRISTLIDKNQSAGIYTVRWDGSDDKGNKAASGLYFYRITSGPFEKIRKMTLLK